MAKDMSNKQKKTNPVLWFLFAIVLPIIIAFILTLIILTAAGADVSGWAKQTGSKIPVISSFITTEEEKGYKIEIEKAERKISDQQIEIETLTNEINNLESIIEQLKQDIVKIENKTSNDEKMNEENNSVLEQQKSQLKNLSASFKKMNKKQAALIFQDLDKDVAISVLEELPNDVRGGILEAMDSKLAAELAELFLIQNN